MGSYRVPTNVVNCKHTGMFQTKRYKVYRVPHLLLSTLTINHPPKVFYIIQPNMTYIFLLPTFLYCVHCPAPLISLLIIKPGMLSVTAHKDHHVFFNSSSCILLCGDTIIYSPSKNKSYLKTAHIQLILNSSEWNVLGQTKISANMYIVLSIS